MKVNTLPKKKQHFGSAPVNVFLIVLMVVMYLLGLWKFIFNHHSYQGSSLFYFIVSFFVTVIPFSNRDEDVWENWKHPDFRFEVFKAYFWWALGFVLLTWSITSTSAMSKARTGLPATAWGEERVLLINDRSIQSWSYPWEKSVALYPRLSANLELEQTDKNGLRYTTTIYVEFTADLSNRENLLLLSYQGNHEETVYKHAMQACLGAANDHLFELGKSYDPVHLAALLTAPSVTWSPPVPAPYRTTKSIWVRCIMTKPEKK